jgi:hypothetical protein
MIIFIVNDFFMRIIITENQYTKLVEQVGVSCVPTGETEFNEVDVSFYDMVRNGSILNYGDYDLDKTHPIYIIQKKLGISRLDNEGKFEELHNRITNQKVKGFDKMLKIVEDFGDGDVIKVNHYVNPSIVDLSTGSTRTIAKSYNNNKKSAKKIGDHIFWWDKRHPC